MVSQKLTYFIKTHIHTFDMVEREKYAFTMNLYDDRIQIQIQIILYPALLL